MGKNGAGFNAKKKEGGKVLYFLAMIFIAISLVFIVVNSTLIFAGVAHIHLLLSALVAFAAGFISWFSVRKIRKGFLFLFSFLFCLLTSCLFFFSAASPGKMSSGVFWPVLVLFCGISFFYAGIMKKKRLLNFYTVIAGAFLILGGVFLLFSSEIIPFPFSSMFVYFFPPSILIFMAVVSAIVNSRRERSEGVICHGEVSEEKSSLEEPREEWF